MLEVKYREEKEQEEESRENADMAEGFELPKNVKQIGEAEKERKLYIEDYVITYLQQLTKNVEETKVAVFLGEKRVQKDCHYLFISAVLEITDVEFGEEQRKKMEEEKQKYFPSLIMMGWFLSVPNQKLELTVEMEQRHRNLFEGEDTILLVREPLEQEEILFLMEEDNLQIQGGYYVYYEQNPGMQEYLMDHKKTESVEEETTEEKAVQSFRKKFRRNQEGRENRTGRWIYGASTMLVLTILVIGVTIINNYDKMKNMEETLTNISKQVTEEPEGEGVGIPVAAQVKSETETPKGKETEEQQTETQKEETQKETKKQEESSAETQSETETEKIEKNEKAETDGEEQTESQEAAARPSQAVYIVKNGDTLVDICQRYYGNLEKVEEICELNNIENQDEIWAGEKIVLP